MTVRVAFLEDDIWVVTPEGRIDVPAARALEDALNELLDKGRAWIVVDCSQATYIASSGLKTLLAALRRAQGLGGDVRLSALGERMLEIFSMAGFDRVFSIHADIPEAVRGLKQK